MRISKYALGLALFLIGVAMLTYLNMWVGGEPFAEMEPAVLFVTLTLLCVWTIIAIIGFILIVKEVGDQDD